MDYWLDQAAEPLAYIIAALLIVIAVVLAVLVG